MINEIKLLLFCLENYLSFGLKLNLEGIGNYPLSCVKCPECAMECYNNFDGLAPCDEDDANLEEEDLACYR